MVENEKTQVTYETQHTSVHPAALGIGMKNNMRQTINLIVENYDSKTLANNIYVLRCLNGIMTNLSFGLWRLPL